MGRSSSDLSVLLISVLLLLSFSHGLGRKVMRSSGKEEESAVLSAENAGMSKEMYDELDYEDPGPNTNPKSGYLPPAPPTSRAVVVPPGY